MKTPILILILVAALSQQVHAQAPRKDTSEFISRGKMDTVPLPDMSYKTKLLPSLIVPAALITYGVLHMKDRGLYSDYEARKDIQRFAKYGSGIDDYLIFAPYVQFGLLLALNVQCKNDVVNTALLILKSQAIMLGLTFPLKYWIAAERPYSYGKGLAGVPLEERKTDANAFVSMPSGHTAQAFCAATIVYREYRHKSVWYGVGAYTIATSVAAFRMINDQHWQSDVFVGAGIGILSANLVYATHLHRWGRKEYCLVPTFDGTNKGMALVCTF